MSIVNEAVLATLNISSYNPFKRAKGKTQEVAQETGADINSVSVTKRLLSKRITEAHTKLEREARAVHYDMTLPWVDRGPALLPVKLFTEYEAAMLSLQSKYWGTVDEFLVHYVDHINEARVRLGDLFNVADYPAAEEIKSKFKFNLRFDQISDSSDIRVNLGAADVEKIRADINNKVNEGMQEAVDGIYDRVLAVTEAMAERLGQSREDGTAQIFRDTLVSNVERVVQLLPALNLTGDPKLVEIHTQMKRLTKYSPAQLRVSESARKETATQAATVAGLAGYMGV